MAKPQTKEQQRVEEIGDRVADARRRLGVTLKRDIKPKDLAELAGVPASTVTRIEGGLSKDPNEATLKRLADALGVTTVWLRYGDQAKPSPAVPLDEPGRDGG